jgi:hypothetical protein
MAPILRISFIFSSFQFVEIYSHAQGPYHNPQGSVSPELTCLLHRDISAMSPLMRRRRLGFLAASSAVVQFAAIPRGWPHSLLGATARTRRWPGRSRQCLRWASNRPNSQAFMEVHAGEEPGNERLCVEDPALSVCACTIGPSVGNGLMPRPRSRTPGALTRTYTIIFGVDPRPHLASRGAWLGKFHAHFVFQPVVTGESIWHDDAMWLTRDNREVKCQDSRYVWQDEPVRGILQQAIY